MNPINPNPNNIKPAMSAKKNQRTKFARLHELLGALGNGVITKESFWERMEEQQLTDSDIDRFCSGEISPTNPDGFLR